MPRRLDISSAAFAGFSVLYPIIAIALIHAEGPGAALVVLLVVLCARLAVPVLQNVPVSLGLALLPVLAAVAAVGAFDRPLAVRLYPVFMNAAMLSVFAVTLWRPPSMIERFARILVPDLPQSGIRYTYRVTIVWIAFFALNGAIALWSALQPGWTAWTLYNGFLSYAAAGVLFIGEYFVRRRVLRRHRP
ncbi:MAG: hypothetical protein ABSC92_03115 [Rhizomicrobium sp.]|jgi:uncharacterized membrane protein